MCVLGCFLPVVSVHCVLCCGRRVVRKQLAFMLGRQQVFLDLDEEADLEDSEELKEIISNVLLNNNFLTLAREVMECLCSVHSLSPLQSTSLALQSNLTNTAVKPH